MVVITLDFLLIIIITCIPFNCLTMYSLTLPTMKDGGFDCIKEIAIALTGPLNVLQVYITYVHQLKLDNCADEK